jgi:hypothetical protein
MANATLVLNGGSSSLKFAVFEQAGGAALALTGQCFVARAQPDLAKLVGIQTAIIELAAYCGLSDVDAQIIDKQSTIVCRDSDKCGADKFDQRHSDSPRPELTISDP